MKHLQIYSLEDEAFWGLITEVITFAKQQIGENEKPDWIGREETMDILGISSPTTLQKLRDEGKIRFSKMSDRHILYYRESVLEYIESKAQETF